MLRDHNGHFSTSRTLVHNWETSGWIHTLVQVVHRVAVLVPLPDRVSVQLDVAQSSSQRRLAAPSAMFYESHSASYSIMYKICTQKVQSSIVHASERSRVSV